MTGKEIVKEIIWRKRTTQAELARATNMKQTSLTTTINEGKHDMRVDTLARLVEAMGCEVIVRDTASGAEWRVTREE